MVKKKAKSSKSAKKREAWQMEDVHVHTGLPPQVEGQLRCFCRVTIGQILWLSPSPPDVTHVRVKWWGEDGDGSIFRPVNANKKGGTTATKTVARYPVRSGPKQFASYLNDMGSLVLEILSGPLMVPVGHAEVTQIGLLSPVRPLNGFYPVFTPQEEKVGEIHVSMVLESLMASYDSMGSIPTTDISMETQTTQESMYPQQRHPIPHSEAPTKPEQDPFISPASHKNGDVRYGERAADLRQQLNYSGQEKSEKQLHAVHSGSTVAITTNGDIVTTSFSNDRNHYTGNTPQSNQASGSDLLSVLLNRGSKLREEMILSSMNSGGQTSVKEVYNNELTVNGTDANLPGLSQRRESAGSLLKEILKADQEATGGVDVSKLDDKAVDLVFGDTGPYDFPMLRMVDGSPGSSVSEVDIVSDPGDPIHNESILQGLFYKNLESDVSTLSELSAEEGLPKKIIKNKTDNTSLVSVDDESNMRPPSRSSSVSSLTFPEPEKENIKQQSKVSKRKPRSKVKRKGSKKRRKSRNSASGQSDSEDGSLARSETSQVSFDMPPSDIDEPVLEKPRKQHSTDGLSVERLTLLGRVHVSRVTISALQLIGQDLDSSVSKKKGRLKTVGKPPKPSPKAKKSMTYFVEYQFPVVATSRDKYSPNAMATEVMRVASKSVKDGVVTFNHRSVFPVMFDGSAVEKWWKSALVFKVYSRTAGQKVPSLVGSCGIPLKSILKSESLHIDKDLEIRESNNRNTSVNSSLRNTDEGHYGNLKISIELASDSRDFSLALARTKLAEMSGKAKIVPIPQPPPPSRPPHPLEATNTSATNTHSHSQVLSQHTISSHRTTEMQTNDLDSHSTQTEPVNVEYGDTLGQILSRGAPLTHQLPPPHSMPYVQQDLTNTAELMTLHTLLLIPEGRNISLHGIPSLISAKRHPIFPHQPHSFASQGAHTRDTSTRNTYIVCRMFWCNDAVHSNVSWGSLAPQFNFLQIAPVLVSQSLLERLRNNFMVIEVWDKKTTAENDKLVGIVKLSLHQFYMSFRDKKIAGALLKSQYPVISVDNYLPIVDPLSGSQYGQLKVLLAMGSAEQVDRLQKLKSDGNSGNLVPERPQHYLERNDVYKQDSSISLIGTECVVEHLFEIVIEGIRGLSLFENMIWGEADSFIQYHFPSQPQSQPGSPVKHVVPSMKSFRSATTLCIPDPTFNDITRHRIMLPQGTPVQRELLTACAGSGGGSGGVPFEVWCRYYHPNVRDQCIAKASLPLAKLCAMVTMQKRGEASVQTFALPLTQVITDSEKVDPESKAKMKESGLMDVTIHYKTQILQNESNPAANRNLTGAQVCISVGIIRAAGLKSAAEAIAHLDSGMQYPAEVGVNAYAKVKLSFLGKGDERITRTIARSFAPEFSHHIDFPCPLLWTEADNDALSLAEILESAEIIIEIWHQVPGLASDLDRQFACNDDVQGRKIVNKTSDVLLGTTTQALSLILTHRTGINGWFPINLPSLGWQKDESRVDESATESESHGLKGLERVVGGLEMSVKFAHHDNRDRVIHAARGVGWSPVDLDIEQDEDWESEDESNSKHYKINICVDQISFPVQNALITGQSTLDKTARCYIRYKLYDKASVISKSVKMNINQAGYIMTNFNHNHNFQISSSSPFKWYLREERLELQLWVSYGSKSEGKNRPQHRDKLIGTAYINLETLGDQRRKQHRISGMYPLFKPGAASLGGAYVRAHVTSKPQFGAIEKSGNDEGEAGNEQMSDSSEDFDTEYDPNDSFHRLDVKKSTKTSPNQPQLVSVQEEVASSFAVVISIERALHLPHICDKNRSVESLPNTYVSYQTSESLNPSHTIVFHNSDNPVWDHLHETKVSTELLYEENKNLVFKVWHKPHNAPQDPDKSSDRVLGFVSVDMTPLCSGLRQICGWYNIVDFNGQCKGQIKVSVVPQESVTRYKQGIAAAAAIPAEPVSLPVGASTFEHSQPWFPDQPVSLPVDPRPFTSNLPHFDKHYSNVKQHHEMLQQQLSQNIRQFLDQQQANLESVNSEEHEPSLHWNPTMQNINQAREPSMHWTPEFADIKFDDRNPASRSMLFSSLRRNLQDLDDMTSKLKSKLHTCEPEQVPIYQADVVCSTPIPMGSGEMTLHSTHSALSTISSLQFTQRSARMNESEVHLTGSNEVESSQTAVDSGAFSVTHSSEKYQDTDPPDSQRSCDRIDTFRMGMTPRDLANTGPLDSERSTFHYGSTPRSVQNNSTLSDTGIHSVPSPRDAQNYSNNSETGCQFKTTPREVDRTGTLSEEHSDFENNPQEIPSTERFQQELRLSPREMTIGTGLNSANSDEVSLGFSFSGEISHRSHGELSHRSQNGANGHSDGHKKDMSIIQENTEDSDGEGGEYYHRYRDLLDEEENNENTDEDDDGDIVVPRTINDVSGKFGGPVMATNISGLRPYTPPKQTGSEGHTMPFDVLGSGSRGTKSSTPDTKKTLSDREDCWSDNDVPNETTTHQSSRKHLFEERDSWMSDSEGENEGENKVKNSLFDPSKDIDIPSKTFSHVNGKTQFSSKRFDQRQELNRNETEEVFVEKTGKHLLSNVELESSSSGSVGHRHDSERGSRLSSADSKRTHRTLSEQSSGSYKHDELQMPDSPKDLEKPQEIESFFSQPSCQILKDPTSSEASGSRSSSPLPFRKKNEIPVFMQNGDVSDSGDDLDDVQTGKTRNPSVNTNPGKSVGVPNFFIPVQHLEESMKALYLATASCPNTSPRQEQTHDQQRIKSKIEATSDMADKLTANSKARFGQKTTKGRQLPTADEAKRIAKIFSQKFS